MLKIKSTRCRCFQQKNLIVQKDFHPDINFVRFSIHELNDDLLVKLKSVKTVVAVVYSNNTHAMAELRRIFFMLLQQGIDVPVIIQRTYSLMPER